MSSDPTVTVRHIRAAKLCMSGAREWFEAHGLSWQDFVSQGLPASTLEQTGDAFALMVTAIARDSEAVQTQSTGG